MIFFDLILRGSRIPPVAYRALELAELCCPEILGALGVRGALSGDRFATPGVVPNFDGGYKADAFKTGLAPMVLRGLHAVGCAAPVEQKACKKEACAIQWCLARRNHQERYCQAFIQAWEDCCATAKKQEAQRIAAERKAAADAAPPPR